MNPIFPDLPAAEVDADVILRLMAEHGAELCAILMIAAGSPAVDRLAFLRAALERPEEDFEGIIQTLSDLVWTVEVLFPDVVGEQEAA